MKISRNIYRQKKPLNLSLQRKIALYFSKAYLMIKLIFIASIIYLFIAQNSSVSKSMRYRLSEFAADIGFVLDNVVISGQHNLSNEDVVATLNADAGTPIFLIDLEEARKNLAENSFVKSVVIQRKLPDTIFVSLLERKPLALWQVNKKLNVIDDDGDIIESAQADKFSNLIHLVGDGANIYANELIKELSRNGSLAGKVKYAIRYGQRRWDLNLENNIIVKMPQNNFASAYDYLIKKYEANELMNQDIKSIDLRDKDKIYIDQHQEKKMGNNKATTNVKK